MKRHVALTLLAVTVLGVLNAHVDLPEVDGRRFVATQGRLHDPQGWLQDQWTSATRRCGAVTPVAPESRLHEQALSALRGFSPPDSASARLLQLQAQGHWLLAEAEFDRLNPVVLLLRQEGAQVQVVERAIWSGSTAPWRPAPRIRQYLASREPLAPQALLACLAPRSALFQPD